MLRWCEIWRSPEKLFATSLEVRDCPFRARGNLAMAWAQRGHLERDEPLVLDCLQEAPWYALGYSMLGRIREEQRALPAARTLYLEALKRDDQEP